MSTICSCIDDTINPICPLHGDAAQAKETEAIRAILDKLNQPGVREAFEKTFSMTTEEIGQAVLAQAQSQKCTLCQSGAPCTEHPKPR